MRLANLSRDIASLPAGAGALEVTRVRRDSRRVEPGDLFVAVPGTRVDGAAFAAQAVKRGAVAVVAERDLLGLDVPVLRAPDAARALGLLADRLCGEPSRDVCVTGVTGTNGKTTTTFLLSSILQASGRPSGLLGTVVNRVGGRALAATMTTPDSTEIHLALARCKAAGTTDLVMEVSSHALDQRRAAGVRFRCGVLTNLTRDHLDYHGTLEAYGAAKARLFQGLPASGVAVLNLRDPFGRDLAARTRARVVGYDWSLQDARRPGPAPAVEARILAEGLDGTRLRLRLGEAADTLTLPLVGRFNVENALAAAAAAWGLGLAPGAIVAALRRCPGVPGRLERVSARPTVLVDYAHTPDALARVLATLRPLVEPGGRLLVVFGCGGDRDRGKRPVMAAAVERYADLAFLTSDNPRGESPQDILSDVLTGFERPGRALVIEDRRRAIDAAIRAAGPRDLVVLAGKGHETGQIQKDRTVPFDDRLVAREALRRRVA